MAVGHARKSNADGPGGAGDIKGTEVIKDPPHTSVERIKTGSNEIE